MPAMELDSTDRYHHRVIVCRMVLTKCLRSIVLDDKDRLKVEAWKNTFDRWPTAMNATTIGHGLYSHHVQRVLDCSFGRLMSMPNPAATDTFFHWLNHPDMDVLMEAVEDIIQRTDIPK